MLRSGLAIGLLWLAASAHGQGAAGSAQGELSVTIYNNDLALVQDVRQVTLPAGVIRQEFPDVSAAIRPESATLTGDGFGIVEQNFDYDLLSPEALMQKAVGQTVTLLRTNTATGAETRERARVLAVNGGVVVQIGERIEVLRDDNLPVRVVFDAIPPNLRARPTLSVTLDSRSAGARAVTLSYLSTGLGWRADYVALFDEKLGKINLQGWITLTNTTGTTFNNARTTLVAGNVEQAQQVRRGGIVAAPIRPQGNRAGTETGTREQLGDFYLYPIKERTTIANAQTKQVSFLDVNGVNASSGYEFRNEWLGTKDAPQSASSVLKFSSAKQGGVGDALPAGIVRTYMHDARGQAQFIGESTIPHTPGGSDLSLRTGDAFDVKVQPIVEKRANIASDEWEKSQQYRIIKANGATTTVTVDRQRQYWRTTMRYAVTNAKAQPVSVDVIQAGINQNWLWNDSRVISESIKGEQLNANERMWKVAVPANGEVALTVVFDTRH
jgi:hypothetical protein